MKQIALTGIKPTGIPHLGNYLGSIEPALNLSERFETFYFIADYHALTTMRNPHELKQQTYQVAATWLALGLNPEETTFYRQSDIPEIFELNWILSCFTAKGLLNRAHAYKAILQKNKNETQKEEDGISAGLFNYPVLMAADILIFEANIVPVGLDQKQHVEIARDIANTLNHTYKKVLVLPSPMIHENVKTIPGIDGQKMSKSYQNTIPIFATSQVLRKRIMKIVTDSKTPEEIKKPDTCNIFSIYKHFASKSEIDPIRKQYHEGGLGYGNMKQILFEALEEKFSTAREKYNYYMSNTKQIDHILEKGANIARKTATSTLKKMKDTIGIS